MNVENTQCCGIGEIEGIEDHPDPEDALREFLENSLDDNDYDPYAYNAPYDRREKPKPAKIHLNYNIYFMSGVTRRGKIRYTYVQKWKRFIERNKLGRVVISKPVTNSNHLNHKVVGAVWTVNARNISKWWKKHGLDE